MTPAAIRIVSQLRQEFYTLFAAAMTVQVHITTGKSYASNPATASWTDSKQQLNYLCIYAHTAPDDLVPERPLVLRLAINRGAGVIIPSKQGKNRSGLSHRWYFELTLLPEQIMDFLPWLIGLIKLRDSSAALSFPNPPYPLDFITSENAQTYEASRKLAQQELSV